MREADTPISSIKLFNNINSSSSVTLSNFATALGEMAVSFTFALPLPFHKETMVYPVILMQENGDAWTLWTRLVKNRYCHFPIFLFNIIIFSISKYVQTILWSVILNINTK